MKTFLNDVRAGAIFQPRTVWNNVALDGFPTKAEVLNRVSQYLNVQFREW